MNTPSSFHDLPLYKRIKWVNTFFLILSPIAAATLLPLDIYLHGWDWRLLAFTVFLYLASSVSITGGYHRLFAHRSYDAKPLVKLFYLLFGAAAVQGSALKWCSDHRRHHKAVDTEDDPYNIKKGFFFAHMGWVFLKEDPKYAGTYYNDLSKDPMIQWQDRHITLLTVLMGFGLPTLVGWIFGSALGGLALGGFVRVVFIHHSTFFINSLCHMVGDRPYSDQVSARDSFIMSFLAYGEGYHNFHHQFASDYRNGIHWYDWDPTKWLVRGMSYVGLTYKLKKTPQDTILRAKILQDEKQMVARGVPKEWLAPVRLKMETAQAKWRGLKEEYATLKRSARDRYDQRREALRAEVKLAKREFKTAWRQWLAYKKNFRVMPDNSWPSVQ